MLFTLVDKFALWLGGDGPEADVVVSTHGVLARNLSDLPFPDACTDEEKRTVEERVLNALEEVELLAGGQYLPLVDLDEREIQFLVEGHLVTQDLAAGKGARGVYVNEDQSVSVMVNEADHIHIQVTAAGLQLSEAWERLSALDDLFSTRLDFAYHDRYGYLTADLARVGSGLKMTPEFHLPALGATQRIMALAQHVCDDGNLAFEGRLGPLHEGIGDLYALYNRMTLGRSEEELVYELRETASRVVAMEKSARDELLQEGPRGLEDRVGRALGMARAARLLDLGEAVELLSSLRLGIELGLLEGYSLQLINELLVASRPAHIELKKGRACDEVTLSVERADLFRARFA
jgi:protein arginine kinase